MKNEIRITCEPIAETYTKDKIVYFVDEIAADGETSNIASYPTIAEANQKAQELSKKYNMPIKWALVALLLFTGQAQASILSLNEAKDKLATIQYHEASSRQDYLASKHAYKAACKARKALQKEIKAIAKANKLNDLAEASSIAYAERAHHYNEYLNAEILGSSTIRIKGGQ